MKEMSMKMYWIYYKLEIKFKILNFKVKVNVVR